MTRYSPHSHCSHLMLCFRKLAIHQTLTFRSHDTESEPWGSGLSGVSSNKEKIYALHTHNLVPSQTDPLLLSLRHVVCQHFNFLLNSLNILLVSDILLFPLSEFTSMFPHVWNAVNMNMKPKPRMTMLRRDFPSGPMLTGWSLYHHLSRDIHPHRRKHNLSSI